MPLPSRADHRLPVGNGRPDLPRLALNITGAVLNHELYTPNGNIILYEDIRPGSHRWCQKRSLIGP